MTVSMRPATRNDALHVAAVIDIAGHGIDAEFWSDNLDGDISAISTARRLILEDTTLPYHLSKSFVLDVDGELAGGLIGGLVTADAEIPPGIPDYTIPLLELESAVPGYWSVVAIAIYQEFRGRGFARKILDFAEAQARREHAPGMSIVVEDTNETAIALYRKVGFQDETSLPWRPYGGRVGPKNWLLLTRTF